MSSSSSTVGPAWFKEYEEHVDGRYGNFRAFWMRPKPGCSEAVLERAMIAAEHETSRGAVWLFADVYDCWEGPLLRRRTYVPWLITAKYAIFYKWMDPTTHNKVPAAATCVTGASVCIMTQHHGTTQLLLSLERRFLTARAIAKYGFAASDLVPIEGEKDYYEMWRLPGGAVDLGESDVAGACREVREEIGVSLSPESLVQVCHENTAASRSVGQFDANDTDAHPLVLNDHYTVYLARVDDPAELHPVPDGDEVMRVEWIDLDKVITTLNNISPFQRTNIKLAADLFYKKQ